MYLLLVFCLLCARLCVWERAGPSLNLQQKYRKFFVWRVNIYDGQNLLDMAACNTWTFYVITYLIRGFVKLWPENNHEHFKCLNHSSVKSKFTGAPSFWILKIIQISVWSTLELYPLACLGSRWGCFSKSFQLVIVHRTLFISFTGFLSTLFCL